MYRNHGGKQFDAPAHEPKHLERSGSASETVEGIRALAIDKDFKPIWNPARLDDVTASMVEPFFVSPWNVAAHPLRNLT